MTTEDEIFQQAKDLGHMPVLPREVVSHLPSGKPLKILDGTFGRGGHAKLIALHRDVDCYLAVDRDPDAMAEAKQWNPGFSLILHDGPYSEMAEAASQANIEGFDAIFLDLGVSSPQLDRAERGFSFHKVGPLDMRMDPRKGESAAQLIARLDEKELADVIFQYGEERASRRIAKAIVRQRQIQAITDTATLAQVIESVMPRQGKLHPATRTFQGLRIAVNAELDELQTALDTIPKLLNPRGRAIIISFHSLEDRPVKQAFAAWKQEGLGTVLTKKVITAGDDEARANSRSRSAKLRVFERGAT